MSKFNSRGIRPAHTQSSVITGTASQTALTGEGGQAYLRDLKSELFVLAVSNFVKEDTFYEKSQERDSRFVQLIHKCALEDPAWTAALLKWLRGSANMRSAAIVGAAEMVKARLDVKDNEVVLGAPRLRVVVDSVIQRADEPGEMLAYWMSKYGKAIPKPIKRGIADAMNRLWSERSVLKYDSSKSTIRFGDVINLVHPKANTAKQMALYKFCQNSRYGVKDVDSAILPMVATRLELNAMDSAGARTFLLSNAELMSKAGVTWEYLGGLGAMDKAAWETVIPEMGIFAKIRNLRNMEEAGISRASMELIAADLRNPDVIAKSRLLPLRFLSAYKAAENDFWKSALDDALNLSLDNVPDLSRAGEAAIFVDVSGSMFSRVSARSEVQYWEVAALFAIALAKKTGVSEIYAFDNQVSTFILKNGANVLKELQRFRRECARGGGTYTVGAVKAITARRARTDSIVILTDEQYGDGWNYYGHTETLEQIIPTSTPAFIFNLAGYQAGSTPSGRGNFHTAAGLSDKSFSMMALLLQGESSEWPWETESS